MLPAFGQAMLKHLPNQLHRKIFERQGGAVEQFHQEMIGCQFLERRAACVAKALIGAGDDIAKFTLAECIAHKGAHHAKGDLLIRQTRHCGDLRMAQLRDACRHIQPPITGKPRQHGVLKCQFRRCAACRDVAHGYCPFKAFCA